MSLAPSSNVPAGLRTEFRTASKAELAALNKKEGRTGVRRYKLAELAIKEIGRTRSPTSEQLAIWATHPDERVPIALLKTGILRTRTVPEIPLTVSNLIDRAFMQAVDSRDFVRAVATHAPVLD